MLEYNVAFHVHSELALRSGRVISLRALAQELTYAGLLEGCPTREMNDGEVVQAQRDAIAQSAGSVAAHVIPPTRRAYLRTPGDMADGGPFGKPEWLPMVRCSALFHGGAVGRRSSSFLRLVWYQDDFALPIAETTISRIRELDWEHLSARPAPPSV